MSRTIDAEEQRLIQEAIAAGGLRRHPANYSLLDTPRAGTLTAGTPTVERDESTETFSIAVD